MSIYEFTYRNLYCELLFGNQKKEFFEKPSEIKKKKLFAAKKRQNKKNRKFR